MMFGIVASTFVVAGGGVSCAYPLDDNGTFASGLGLVYAGPATGVDLQGLSFTSTGNQIAILAPADPLGIDTFQRPATNNHVAEFNYTSGTVTWAALGIYISDNTNAFVNGGLIICSTPALAAVTVGSDGTVTGYVDNLPVAITWQVPAGQTTVGATDKYSLVLLASASDAGQTAVGALRTSAEQFTGTAYGVGDTDPCGTAI